MHLTIKPGWSVPVDFHAGQYLGIGVRINGRYVWLNGDSSLGVLAHELGQNLGLNHADYGHCAAGSNRITLGTAKQCTFVEYGDSADMMGAFSENGWFSGARLDQLGWVTKAQKASNTSGAKKAYSLVPVSSS